MNWYIDKVQERAWIKNYPFFHTLVRIKPSGFEYNNIIYSTVQQIENVFKKEMSKVNVDELRFTSFGLIRVHIPEESWPNNIGNGLYVGKYKNGEKYSWVFGAQIYTSLISNDYSVRFPENTSYEDRERWVKKVLKRHIKRFLSE